MPGIRRRVSAVVNPMSTAVTRWWCGSALRHLLTGHGPTASQRRLIRRGTPVIRAGRVASARQETGQMEARRKAIDDLLSRDGHKM